jgi:CTP:molybdopterin cytidylyltransferase MocA
MSIVRSPGLRSPSTPPKFAPLPEQPKVSVVTVSYNHASFIETNIRSVLAQDYANLEHIIVDGGSNDGTREILQRYPHLKWTSEPDHGQSDALNKGFRQASGDIIVWLNSDDCLAPGALAEVIPLLRQHPVVMGACELLDAQGNRKEIVQNCEHDWFDFIKYWVFDSSPAQPSVMFRRELLEVCARSSGQYLNQELIYCMDWDLWLRMARYVPFALRSEKILSRYPVYEGSKTGGDRLPLHREMVRVYRRFEREFGSTAATLSVVLPVPKGTSQEHYLASLRSLSQQLTSDFEVLILAELDPGQRHVSRFFATIPDDLQAALAIRVLPASSQQAASLLRQTAQEAQAPYIVWLSAGSTVAEDFLLKVVNLFQEDQFAFLTPHTSQIDALRLQIPGPPTRLDISLLFAVQQLPGVFALRRLALADRSEFLKAPHAALVAKEFALLARHASWQIGTIPAQYSEPTTNSLHPELCQLITTRFNAQLVLQMQQIAALQPFHAVRLKHHFSFEFPTEVYAASQRLAQTAPQDWLEQLLLKSPVELEQLARDYPKFAACCWMAHAGYHQRGDAQACERTRADFAQALQREQAL